MSQPPLPAETRYWSRVGDRQRIVTSMFDHSAAHYDRACGVLSFGSGQRYRRDALERTGICAGMCVLDVGFGTGLLGREIAGKVGSTGRVVGLDPSREMMSAGARRSIGLVQAVGDRLPFTTAQFDCVTMGYALRHVADLDQMFGEFRRVLKDGGRVLLLEITRPESSLGMSLARVYFGTLVPLMTRVATRSAAAAELMRFFWDTIAHCVPPETVLESLRRAGFSNARRTVSHKIFSEYTATRAG
jgi:demethylmenaquinone methyltransferase / 2-methoxy-6-polyprenyl-1,4-benzoquinol methylase